MKIEILEAKLKYVFLLNYTYLNIRTQKIILSFCHINKYFECEESI